MQLTQELLQRLTRLEAELQHTNDALETAQTDLKELEKKMSYYDKMALKWGGACMGAIAFGALVGGHIDNLREKIVTWIMGG